MTKPLTGAEKTRRYREKLKKERPEEYAAQCRRNLERMKFKKKKISEMTPEEAEKQRESWRKDKKKSNDRKKAQKEINTETYEEESTSKERKTILSLRARSRFFASKYRHCMKQMKTLKKTNANNKKKYQRLQSIKDEKIKELELTITKMQVRQEVLEYSLKKTYENSQTRTEKNFMKKLVENSTNKKYMSNMLGLKVSAKPSKPKKRPRINFQEITDFYLKDDVSRNTAGIRQTRTFKKEKRQIRFLLDTLLNLYKKYKEEGGRYGFSTFYKCKPFYVLISSLSRRDTCLCIKHENIKLQNIALKKVGALSTNLKEGMSEISCNTKNYACMYSKCQECCTKKIKYDTVTIPQTVTSEAPLTNVSWHQWVREDHTYTKKEGNVMKEITTKKTKKVKKTGTLQDLQELYEKNFREFKKHHYNMEYQQAQYQKAISELKQNEVVIVCDFSQNYEAKLAEEIQALHFGASKNQITLHTGMIIWQKSCQSFCTIADTNDHKPSAIWAHLTPIFELIKEKTPEVTVVHLFSDGPSSQYRQKNNFFLLTHFTRKYNLDYCTWSFYESGHGKSVADGIGGSVKRSLDKKVCQGIDVADAKDAYDVLKLCLKRIKVFLIYDRDIAVVNSILPTNVQALKGTLQLHQIITDNHDHTVQFRDISCFCGLIRGKCDCFTPQSHCLLSTKVPRPGTSRAKNIPVTSVDNHRASIENREPIAELASPPTTLKLSRKKHLHHDIFPTVENFPLVDIQLKRPKNLAPAVTHESKNNQQIDVSLELESFSASDLESLKYLDRSASNENESPIHDIMDIDVLPIVILPEAPKTTIDVEDTDKELALKPLKGKDMNILEKTKVMSSKFLRCNKCKSAISGSKSKCIACKQWYCNDCTDGPQFAIDFICDVCLLLD